MVDLPSIHPRVGRSKRYSIPVKQQLLGEQRISEERLRDTFPGYLENLDIQLVDRESILASTYEAESTYVIRVIAPRHLQAHKLLTRIRNTIFNLTNLPKPFCSFGSTAEMTAFEYQTANQLHEEGAAIVTPHEYTQLDGGNEVYAILYDYLPHSGKIEGDDATLNAFDYLTDTLRVMHDQRRTHTALPHHILRTVPDGEPAIIDPVGRTHDTPIGHLLGVGFDLASLMSRYANSVGTLPTLNIAKQSHTELELIAAYQCAFTLQLTTPQTYAWVARHIRSSIDEYVSHEAANAYFELLEKGTAADLQTISLDSFEPENREIIKEQLPGAETYLTQPGEEIEMDDNFRMGSVKHDEGLYASPPDKPVTATQTDIDAVASKKSGDWKVVTEPQPSSERTHNEEDLPVVSKHEHLPEASQNPTRSRTAGPTPNDFHIDSTEEPEEPEEPPALPPIDTDDTFIDRLRRRVISLFQ